MHPQQTINAVAKALHNKIMKYTHQIVFKNGQKVIIQSDSSLDREFCTKTRQTILHGGEYPRCFECNWEEVFFTQTEKNAGES